MTIEISLVECRELVKVFNKKDKAVRALDNVGLSIHKRDFLAIVGRSGAGKTTLLNLMGGLDHPTSGTIILDGENLEMMTDKELTLLRMRKIGFVFQDFNLLHGFTAFENLEMALVPAHVSRKDRRDRIQNLLHAFHLTERAHHLPAELSVGQRQRVAIARALANDPTLILADEPTGELDPLTAEEVVERFAELNRKYGVTLVITTCGTFPYNLANRVLFMKDGRIVERREAGY